MNRETKRAELLDALTKYRGGRFSTSGSGGAGGMVFHTNAEGQQFYIGSVQEPHASTLVSALNLTMELLNESDRVKAIGDAAASEGYAIGQAFNRIIEESKR